MIDVSKELGEYMLKGWVLTDNTCPTPNCRVPLMRSPNSIVPVTFFCANCDGDSRSQRNTQNPASVPFQSSPSASSASHVSRSSTPPTEISEALSSPTFVIPVETEEMRQRRQQSDLASAELGRRLLKGWAMLADECPNPTCYGVPLVRPPKTGADKDPRKECVICGNVYVSEGDVQRFTHVLPLPNAPAQNALSRSNLGAPALVNLPHSQGSELQMPRDDISQIDLPAVSSVPSNQLQREHVPELSSIISTGMQGVQSSKKLIERSSSTTGSALGTSVRALELALYTLSQKLTFLCSNPAAADSSLIGSTADAVKKVTEALMQVKQLQWSENQGISIP